MEDSEEETELGLLIQHTPISYLQRALNTTNDILLLFIQTGGKDCTEIRLTVL